MSGREYARLTIDPGASPVARDAWLAFCAENGFRHLEGALGGQVFHSGETRASFAPGPGGVYRMRERRGDTPPLADVSREIVFSTFPGGLEAGRLARLARDARKRFGGAISASPAVSGHLPG